LEDKSVKITIKILLLTGCLALFLLTGACGSPAPVSQAEPLPSPPMESEVEPEASREAVSEPEISLEESPGEAAQTESTSQQAASEADTASSPAESHTMNMTVPAATPFSLSPADVRILYARNYSDYTYAPMDADATAEAIALINKAGQAPSEEIYSANEGGFLAVMNDGDNTRFSYSLMASAVRVDNEAHRLSSEDYAILKGLADAANQNNPSFAQWLIYMDVNRLQSVSYFPGTAADPCDIPDTAGAAAIFKGIKVQKGSGNAYDIGQQSFDATPNRTVFRLSFDGSIVYSLAIESGMLYVESSDMTYGCQYQLLTSEANIHSAFAPLIGGASNSTAG